VALAGSYTVYIDRLSAIRAENVADNNGNNDFSNPEIPGLSHGNPGIGNWKSGPRSWDPESRDWNP